MATNELVIAAEAEHPLTTYLKANKAARDLLKAEIRRLEEEATDGATAAIRNSAILNGPELVSELGHFDDEHDLFLLKVFTLGSNNGPADNVVSETVALNNALAAAIIKANHAKLMLGILKSYLDGAIAVFNGTVLPAAGGEAAAGG